MSERQKDEEGRRYLEAGELLSGEPTVRDFLEGGGTELEESEFKRIGNLFGWSLAELAREWTGVWYRFLIAVKDRMHAGLVREKEAQRNRGAESAAIRKAKSKERDEEIAELALAKAQEAESLANNSKLLASQILSRWWEPRWGKKVSVGRLRNILSEQGVLRALKKL